jgi:hypothetical protein
MQNVLSVQTMCKTFFDPFCTQQIDRNSGSGFHNITQLPERIRVLGQARRPNPNPELDFTTQDPKPEPDFTT